ncbi:MAG: aspartyl protease family protein [Acidobacteria bacterium]|nr:aspartyl protease family protein [Acidobacteriota bacterium]
MTHVQRGARILVVPALIAAASFIIHAEATAPQSSVGAEVQLQLAQMLHDEGGYAGALEAYRLALQQADGTQVRRARVGVIQMALRTAEFELARREAAVLLAAEPSSAEARALAADALWASGHFEQAEAKYHEALDADPELARAHHGIAKSLAAQSRLDAALAEAREALRLAPRDMEIHHTVGMIYERMHRFEEAAAAYTNYTNLLPNKDRSAKADWSRAEIRFLRSFGERVPFDMEPGADQVNYTIGFRLVNDKMVVRAKVNDAAAQDFIVDTGSENTVITRFTAQRLNVQPVTYTLSAGVGEVGLRGLQLARIDSLEIGELKLRNVPVLIKNPPLRDMPTQETESLSPLALGFSMTIDYARRQLTFGRHLAPEPSDAELPLRLCRLAMVNGMLDGVHDTNFVVDTGGEVISISQATASAIGKSTPENRIALKVYGTSGWDRDAFLLPGVNLAFSAIRYNNFPVVVLNLAAPSALLGFQLGGTVGHKFLSRYRVGIDLERSTLRLRAVS